MSPSCQRPLARSYRFAVDATRNRAIASPRVVSRQEIEREIWGNSLPDSDTLRSHLYNLRKVIDKPFDKQLLHTVQSAGYRIADIATQVG